MGGSALGGTLSPAEATSCPFEFKNQEDRGKNQWRLTCRCSRLALARQSAGLPPRRARASG